MGGMQPISEPQKFGEKLFRDSGDLYGRKTADDKLTELRDDCRQLCKYTSQNVNDLSQALLKSEEEITLLKKEIDFLKQQITNGSTGKWGAYANKEEMQGTFDLYRQMQILLKQDFDKLKSNFESASKGLAVVKPTSEVKQSVKIEQPKDNCPDGWMYISDLTKLVSDSLESGKIKCNKEFGEQGKIGDLFLMLNIVKTRSSSRAGRTLVPTGYGESIGCVKLFTNHKGGYCFYNVEKCKAILEDVSKNPLGLIKKHADASKKYYEGATA